MTSYHLNFISDAQKDTSFKNKKILELGCGNGDMLKLIAEYYNPKMIIGIDKYLDEGYHIKDECAGPNWKIINGDAESLPFDDNTFDTVISVSTFEHIHDIETTLSEIKRVLKPFGRFYTGFAPIWTSVLGHHYNHTTADDVKLIPPWGHLYMNEKEMCEHIISCGKDRAKAEEIASKIYNNPYLNRHSRSDLIRWVMGAGMHVRHYKEIIAFSREHYTWQDVKPSSDLTEDIKSKIKNTKYKCEDLGVIYMYFILEKYNSL